MSQMQPQPQLQGSPPGLPGGGIAALLGGGAPSPDQPDTPSDPLSSLQDLIEAFPPVLHALTDANDVHNASKAFTVLLGIQARLMGNGPAQGQSG